jgi:hypothetical protein
MSLPNKLGINRPSDDRTLVATARSRGRVPGAVKARYKKDTETQGSLSLDSHHLHDKGPASKKDHAAAPSPPGNQQGATPPSRANTGPWPYTTRADTRAAVGAQDIMTGSMGDCRLDSPDS